MASSGLLKGCRRGKHQRSSARRLPAEEQQQRSSSRDAAAEMQYAVSAETRAGGDPASLTARKPAPPHQSTRCKTHLWAGGLVRRIMQRRQPGVCQRLLHRQPLGCGGQRAYFFFLSTQRAMSAHVQGSRDCVGASGRQAARERFLRRRPRGRGIGECAQAGKRRLCDDWRDAGWKLW